jgi:hypothetical protein
MSLNIEYTLELIAMRLSTGEKLKNINILNVS